MQSPLSSRTIRPPGFSAARTFEQLLEIRRYWDLLLTLSLHRVKVRYKQSALGVLWAILQPVLLMVIYTVIFSTVARMPSEGIPYSVFVFCALLPWTFFNNAIAGATNCLVSHQYLITKVYFPREILPLSYLGASVFDLLFASTVLAGLMIWHGLGITPAILWALPALAVCAAFTLALSLLLSTLHVSFRDIGLGLPLLMQVWVFATPVVYPLSAVPPRLRGWYALNPMAGVVENFRRAVLQGLPPDFDSLRTAAIATLVLLVLAYGLFKHREATLADVI